MLLAIDTSTRQAGVALYDGDRGLLAEYNWVSANRHTEELMPTVAQLLDRAGERRDLAAVGVAIGPGSFTGLRVGLAAAKGVALAHGLPLVGVSTLDFTAYPHREQGRSVIALVQAGRSRVCWAAYAHGPDGWAALAPYVLATYPSLAASLVALSGAAMIVVGEVSRADRATLAELLTASDVRLLPPALSIRRAGHLAELAWERHVACAWDDPATLSPLYMQQPDGSATYAAGARPAGVTGVAA